MGGAQNKMNNKDLIVILVFVFPILLVQGIWIFKDAKRRGEKLYWLWGLFGVINTPSNLLIYLIVTRVIFKNDKQK